MIEKEHGKYNLVCDECMRYIPGFDTFQDALDYAEEMEWSRKRVGNEWENYCEDCKSE